jgi:hypothetical protein
MATQGKKYRLSNPKDVADLQRFMEQDRLKTWKQFEVKNPFILDYDKIPERTAAIKKACDCLRAVLIGNHAFNGKQPLSDPDTGCEINPTVAGYLFRPMTEDEWFAQKKAIAKFTTDPTTLEAIDCHLRGTGRRGLPRRLMKQAGTP